MTDVALANHWASTRTDPTNWDFAIHVVDFFFNEQPTWAPLYFVNQYEEGVTTSNHGMESLPDGV